MLFDTLSRPRQDRFTMASERIQRRIEQLLDEADEAVANSDWARVKDRAKNVLRLDPDNGEALALLTAADRDVGGDHRSEPTAAPVTQDTSTTEAQPTYFANGRYSVTRFLGEGGLASPYQRGVSWMD